MLNALQSYNICCLKIGKTTKLVTKNGKKPKFVAEIYNTR